MLTTEYFPIQLKTTFKTYQKRKNNMLIEELNEENFESILRKAKVNPTSKTGLGLRMYILGNVKMAYVLFVLGISRQAMYFAIKRFKEKLVLI
jgi:hypothetical protein